MAPLLGHYEMFFAASAGASAAILGLLVVAVSVVNADDTDAKTRERRTVLAGSAFLALVDAFFVSIVALTGGAAVFGTSNVVMAMVGLLATRRLIPRAKRAGTSPAAFQLAG
jgi:hypothetical protein